MTRCFDEISTSSFSKNTKLIANKRLEVVLGLTNGQIQRANYQA
jgi:hypothetical protein